MNIEQIEKFVRINNRQAFLLDSIPVYYPGTKKYIDFWKQEKKYCIEGKWCIDHLDQSQDKGFWRWMPGALYFYVNYGSIIHNDKATGYNIGEVTRPVLRDVEWELFYNYYECMGFSGFMDDDEYTSDAKILEVSSVDDLNLNIKQDRCLLNKKGELKKYISARENLRRLHNQPKGIALFYNKIRNLFLIGTRGFGKSFSVGGGIVAHRFLFDGLELSMEPYSAEMSKPQHEIVVGAAYSDKSADTLEKFKLSIDNLPGSYFDGKNNFPSPFAKMYKGTLKVNNGDNKFRHKYDINIGGKWVEKGTGTAIKHVVYPSHNPDSAVGGRFALSVVEEVGLMGHVLAVHGANEACQRISEKMGVTIYIGTGGNFDKIRESEIIFRDPIKFDILDFDDTYEGTGKIGWFMPRHYGLNQFKDEHGNTDLEKAHKYLMAERTKKFSGGNGSVNADKYIMSYPITPSEMFLSKKGNVFPLVELRERLKELRAGNKYHSLATPVELYWDKGVVKYKIDENNVLQPLWDTHSHNMYKNKEGAVLIYEFPKMINGIVPNNMYIIGVDPFKNDEDGDSLAAVYVMKNYEYALEGHGYSEIVAEYVGRPAFGGRNAINEIIEKLSLFYGATPGGIFFENNVGNIKDYFVKIKKSHLLALEPDYLLTNNTKISLSTKYGVSTSNKIVKEKIIEYLVEWLVEKRELDDDGRQLRNLDLIPSPGLIEDMIAFSYETNHDRVMGMAMAVIGLRAKYNEFKHQREEASVEKSMYSWLSKNPKLFKKVV